MPPLHIQDIFFYDDEIFSQIEENIFLKKNTDYKQ